ncbi:hypothetical protein G9C98_003317 [Cotesia typhae]|uniref:Chitin-binding type-2 domain-containing protein n=1 Tax=Cotesia typhae TaxID=2053667 RepID=A0A8J5R1F7_9HYME|nr:hypothetical protein G9C98_003317 [Cotesia typhae]
MLASKIESEEKKWYCRFGVLGCTWRETISTCVLESDFGFMLNCVFKKSSLFRVRNLGGVKGYVGLGFSVGDELGFQESLSNLESSKRRSVQADGRNTVGIGSGVPQTLAMNVNDLSYAQPLPHIVAAIPPAGSIVNMNNKIASDSKPLTSVLPLPNDEMTASVNEMTLQSLNPANTAEAIESIKQQNEKRQSLPSLKPIQGMETSLKALAEASNITLEALEAAILLRQQQVDLPDTSFYCGDQKHFPGLYADEDLGCMVFHVCALTDQGLIMKSFLCPESTLFDQTILKCNWWFYVDCKSSKSLYDSNIPISKSYQLMKALAFFSAYKNHDNATMSAESGS